MTHKPGEWSKPPGGDFGVFWDGTSWKTFECLGCAIADGALVPRYRLPWGPKFSNLYSRRLQRNMSKAVREGKRFQERGDLHDIKHDPTKHNKWIIDGKPHRKE